MEMAWCGRQRRPHEEAPPLPALEATRHPLQPAAAAAASSGAPRGGGGADPLTAAAADPLSAAAADPLSAVAADPLSAAASDPLSSSNTFSSLGSVQLRSAAHAARASRFLSWKARRGLILKQYAVAGRLRVHSDLLNVDGVASAALGSNLDDSGAASDKKVESQLDSKTRRRLEELAASEEDGRGTLQLTQQELIARVETLDADLRRAWEAEERVRALKIAIQLSKMLGDTSFPQFLPSVFALVSGVLDSFGELVYQRVFSKATPPGGSLPAEFELSELAEEGVETTRNWFYKVASIRELVPRLYVEVAIIKCYRLLHPASELPKIIAKIHQMVRGFGNPLIACYMRSYLVHKLLDVAPLHAAELVMPPLMDTFATFERQVNTEAFAKHTTAKAGLTLREYCVAFVPPLEWLLQCVAEQHPAQEMLIKVIKSYRQHAKTALVLNAIISSFDQAMVAEMALPICELIKEADDSSYAKYHCYVSLGKALCLHPPPKEQQLQIVNDVWAAIAAISSPREYVSVAVQYLRFLLAEFGPAEVMKLLKDIIRRVTPEKAYLEMQPLLQQAVSAVLEVGVDFGVYVAMEPFQRLLGLFDGETAANNNKMIMDAFSKTSGTFSDPVLINNLTHVARCLHDSLDSLSFDDERRQLGFLINAFIRKISFGKDLERHLNFYADCRAAFANLDIVKDTLVLGVFGLAMRTRATMRGRHNKRTSGFVKACVAFCFITIPSIDNTMLRLNLCLLGAQASLANSLLPQMDAFVKAAVTLLPEILTPPDADETAAARAEACAREQAVVGILSSACSFLVMVPGHPEHGPFYLVAGLLNVMQTCPWRLPTSLPSLYLRMLSLFNTYGQAELPYHVTGVDSNDVLYAVEAEYQEALEQLSSKVLGEFLGALKELGDKADAASKRAQASLALQLFDLIVGTTTLEAPLVALAANLYGLAAKSAHVDRAHLKNLTQWVARRAKTLGKQADGQRYLDLYARVQQVQKRHAAAA